jgi:hypothetical protein
MENPDPFAADAGGDVAGQLAEASDQLGELPGGGAEPGDDLIGAVDHVVADVIGIGAATPGGLVLGGQLGFHVALDGVVGQDRLADRAEVVGVDVQPMEVAVEHDRRRAVGLLVGPLEHGREGSGVAVQAADDIEGVGLQLGWLGERLRLVSVGQRAGPAARIHAFLPGGLRIQ